MYTKFAEPRFIKAVLEHNHWGKEFGRTLMVTSDLERNLVKAMEKSGEHGRVQTVEEVDVKDLLELGRIVIEKNALDRILSEHQSDLVNRRTVA